MAMKPIAIEITAEKAGESICRAMAAEAHLVAGGFSFALLRASAEKDPLLDMLVPGKKEGRV